MLHTGNVLLFSWPNDTVGSDAVLWNPPTGRTTNIALTYQRDIFCSGTTVLSDGRVFIAGGHVWQGRPQPHPGCDQHDHLRPGVQRVDRCNPASSTINRLPATADRAMVTYPRVTLTTGG